MPFLHGKIIKMDIDIYDKKGFLASTITNAKKIEIYKDTICINGKKIKNVMVDIPGIGIEIWSSMLERRGWAQKQNFYLDEEFYIWIEEK